MPILVIAEHDNRHLHPSTYNTIGAANQIGGDIDVLVAGHNCQAVAAAAGAIEGVTNVYRADSPLLAAQLASALAAQTLTIAGNYSHILAPATTFGKDLLPRIAARLDVAQISDILAVVSADTFVRPIYAGNAWATVQSTDPIKVISIRTTAFAPAGCQEVQAKRVELTPIVATREQVTRISQQLTQSERPDLRSASVVISGGRGLGSGENFKLLEQLADRLGAAIGASRAAVDAGFVPSDYQVGQTGKIVAPDLYIAIGISGAIQHLAGMKESRLIVAINKDAEAPIFQVADYALVGDLFEIIPQLIEALDQAKATVPA